MNRKIQSPTNPPPTHTPHQPLKVFTQACPPHPNDEHLPTSIQTHLHSQYHHAAQTTHTTYIPRRTRPRRTSIPSIAEPRPHLRCNRSNLPCTYTRTQTQRNTDTCTAVQHFHRRTSQPCNRTQRNATQRTEHAACKKRAGV